MNTKKEKRSSLAHAYTHCKDRLEYPTHTHTQTHTHTHRRIVWAESVLRQKQAQTKHTEKEKTHINRHTHSVAEQAD